MEASGRRLDGSLAAVVTSASHALVCLSASPVRNRAPLQTMLIEAVVMRKGALPHHLDFALRVAFEPREMSELGTQWLIYGLRTTARQPQLPTAESSDRDTSQGSKSHHSLDQFQLLSQLVSQAAGNEQTAKHYRDALLDALISVLSDDVALRRKATLVRAVLKFCYPVPHRLLRALIQASPMPPIECMPTEEQVEVSDAWARAADHRNPRLVEPLVTRCLVSQHCRAAVANAMLDEATKNGRRRPSRFMRRVHEAGAMRMTEPWPDVMKSNLALMLLRVLPEPDEQGDSQPPVEAQSWDTPVRQAVLVAAIAGVKASVSHRIEAWRDSGRQPCPGLVRVLSLPASRHTGLTPWSDCFRLAGHRRWLGSARNHVSIRSECESERVVWALYSAAVDLGLSGDDAATGNVDLALADASPFVRAAAFAAFQRRSTLSAVCIEGGPAESSNVARLLREVSIQCARDGPVERQLLCDQLNTVANSIRLRSQLSRWSRGSDAAGRALCVRLFEDVCASLAAERNESPLIGPARLCLGVLMLDCKFITGEGKQGLSSWCRAYRAFTTVSGGPDNEVIDALCQGSENLSLAALRAAPPEEIAAVTEFAVLAAKKSMRLGSKVIEVTRPMMRAAAKLLPVSSAPQVLDELMQSSLPFAGVRFVATLKYPHLIGRPWRAMRGRGGGGHHQDAEDFDAGPEVVLTIARRWLLEAPERLRVCLYDLTSVCWRRGHHCDLSIAFAMRVLALFETLGDAANRLLPAHRYDAIAGQLLRWIDDSFSQDLEWSNRIDDFVTGVAAHIARVKDARRFVDGFDDSPTLVHLMEERIFVLFSRHDGLRSRCDAHSPPALPEKITTNPAATDPSRRDNHDTQQSRRLLAALSATFSPYAELCYRFADRLQRPQNSAPLMFTRLKWLCDSASCAGQADRYRRRLALLASCATIEWNSIEFHRTQRNQSSPLRTHVTISIEGARTTAATEQHPLQWMNQCAGHVLRALPRSVDATADAAEGAVRGVRHVDKTVTQCNDEDRDDLLAPLTLEFCTSLRTLLMRDIAFFTPASSGGLEFPTHLALLLLELHRHTVFARGALHTAAMVDECADCFARMSEWVPPEVASSLRSLQASVRLRSGLRSVTRARDEHEACESEPALRKSARQEPRESCEESV
jgi:hypothetical protein